MSCASLATTSIASVSGPKGSRMLPPSLRKEIEEEKQKILGEVGELKKEKRRLLLERREIERV